jgi:hypothetical protein
MNFSPIVLFVYNRPLHTKQTINALLKNKLASNSEIFIFSDGAKKDENPLLVEQVRSYLITIKGFKSIKIIKRKFNYGLSRSIISGVTKICKKYGRVIVLEDDMITSKFFLEYMNNALNFYKNDNRVISIHGYVYPTLNELPEAFFLKGADCWGWATWANRWKLLDQDSRFLLDSLERLDLIYDFNFQGSCNYITMLKDQIMKKNDSWAIKWYASAFIHNKLTLYPGRSLIQNIGLDSSGVHCSTDGSFYVSLSKSPINFSKIKVEHSHDAYKEFISFFNSKKSTLISRTVKKIINFFKF